jgi:IS30 family transposase
LLNAQLWQQVMEGLRKRWSPEQIAGDFKKRFSGEPERQVSHETIYTGLHLLPRGQLRKELLLYFRQSHADENLFCRPAQPLAAR